MEIKGLTIYNRKRYQQVNTVVSLKEAHENNKKYISAVKVVMSLLLNLNK